MSSPGGNAEQKMGELSDILGVRAIAVKEVSLLDQIFHLGWTRTIVIPRAQLDDVVT